MLCTFSILSTLNKQSFLLLTAGHLTDHDTGNVQRTCRLPRWHTTVYSSYMQGSASCCGGEAGSAPRPCWRPWSPCEASLACMTDDDR